MPAGEILGHVCLLMPGLLDTLLVLFNVAISNLVRVFSLPAFAVISAPTQILFRNNFALSRDLAGSFQSFQSSDLVLEPALNPTLFQGKLAIIVKVPF